MEDRDGLLTDDAEMRSQPRSGWEKQSTTGRLHGPDLVQALTLRSLENGWLHNVMGGELLCLDWTRSYVDRFAAEVLVVPRSEHWREAVSTALLGDWCEPLLRTGRLPDTALGRLRAEARAVHRQLVPVWRRRTRHGRLLSLDATLGDGLSLYDLVADDIDLLARAAGGVFDDERLNAALRSLSLDERRVVLAYAEGAGTTWAEAAATTGAKEPEVLGMAPSSDQRTTHG